VQKEPVPSLEHPWGLSHLQALVPSAGWRFVRMSNFPPCSLEMAQDLLGSAGTFVAFCLCLPIWDHSLQGSPVEQLQRILGS
jgi:hypothetical protein